MAQHSAQAAVGGVFQERRGLSLRPRLLLVPTTLYVIIVAQTLFRSDSPGRDMRYGVRGGMYARLDSNS